jgi:hypothetical protein
MNNSIQEILQVLVAFQDGYTARDISKLDQFMELFLPGDEVEFLGTGASTRNGNEWCQGSKRIREIIESDWKYWGDVRLDIKDARVTVMDDVAWLSTPGAVLQTNNIYDDEVTRYYLEHIKELIDDDTLSQKERLVEATHYGVRRWRRREKPIGYPWPLVFTAVLVKQEGQWRFHTVHWSMPVD